MKWTQKIRERWSWVFGGGEGWFANTATIPPWPGRPSAAGRVVTVADAGGLPAVAQCIRLFAETTGLVPCVVYSGDAPERERARDSWQWYRLHERPNDDQSAFDFFQDIETGVEATGNGFIWKAKGARVIRDAEDIQLFAMDPFIVRVAREGGRKVFKIREDGQERTYDSTNIIHVRGWTLRAGADEGVSPIALHRETLGVALAQQDYEGRFYSNNAQTTVAIVVPEMISDEEAAGIADLFVVQHTGPNAFRPAVIRGGGDVKQLSISAQDAQYIQTRQMGLEDVARMFHLSAVGMLSRPTGTAVAEASDDFERFLKVDLSPRLRRIELALRGDQDLFPRNLDLFPEFLTDAVLKPDIKTRYEAFRLAKQGGWMTANEIRERENLPPHDQGDVLQETPVGGAPNPGAENGG
jgi:HK97 family phage portal protein